MMTMFNNQLGGDPGSIAIPTQPEETKKEKKKKKKSKKNGKSVEDFGSQPKRQKVDNDVAILVNS